jgi:glycerol-3-phosphate dehydrogenase
MTAPSQLNVDVVIMGGGVAGLWSLAKLRKLGFSAVLLEANALGAGQTLYAQGIIHGGMKYALTGKLSDSSKAVARMPGLWRDCLQGKGEIDLSAVKILSPYQYLWSTQSLSSKMAGFFASKVMSSRTTEVSGAQRPHVFQNADFHGQVYRLQESILDTASLVHALAEPRMDAIFKFD